MGGRKKSGGRGAKVSKERGERKNEGKRERPVWSQKEIEPILY